MTDKLNGPDFSQARVVDDEWREKGIPVTRGQPRNPLYEQLAEGKTVFFPADSLRDKQSIRNRIVAAAKYRGFRCRTAHVAGLDDQEGIVAWWDKIEATT